MDITPEKSFDVLKKNIVESISSYFPYTDGRKNKIVLDSIQVNDKLSIDDIRSQTEAKDLEKTWGVPVVAQLSLIDKATGKVIDRRKTTLATIPKLTNRYGFIVGGNEYQVDHLFRLKSGVYARVQDNGELESEFNLAKKVGRNFSIHLKPATKIFSFKYGSSFIPLYPILKTMGVSDDELEKEWGPEIFRANKEADKGGKALAKFIKSTSEGDDLPAGTDPVKYIHSYFDKTGLLPDTTKVTLGKSFTKVDGEVLRLASGKILGVSRGVSAPDDRDSLAFKEIVSVEDFLPETLAKKAKSIRAKLRETVDHKSTITEIVSPELFKKPINDFFVSSGGSKVIERSEQTNPLQMVAGHRKTTLFSDLGGIKNQHAVTDAMQVINPSHFGFLDPMHTPESEKTGISLYLAANVRKNGRDLETPAYNLKSGKLDYVKVPEFHSSVAVLPDQVRWVRGKPVPIAAKVKVKLPGGDIEERPFSEANYVLPSAKGMFDHTSNLIPFLPTDQGNRVSMADKQMEQAISLKHREAPLVQSKTEGAHTFERSMGTFSSTAAPISGKVLAIKKDAIVIGEGKKKHEVHLYDHFPLNDAKGMMHSEPTVKVGDTVKKGQLIADTNFTRDGNIALGANLRVGYMPYKGYNYEDGIVISESAAKKLTSEHLYKKDLEVDTDNDIVNKAKWFAFSPRSASNLSKEQLAALDDDGVIKVGTKVKPGTVLIAALAKNDLSKDDFTNRYGESRIKKLRAWRDKSMVWDEDHVGEVVKVVRSPSGKGIKVYVRTEEQMVIGDKLSGRHGNKGIVTQIIPDHEMPFTIDPKTKDRRHLEVLLNPSGVPTRINVGQILETAAGKIAEKTGKPYVVNNFAGPGHDYRAQVENDLKAHGINDEEHVYDPKEPNKVMGSVLVGPQHLLKLRHQVEKKLSVRGGGTTIDDSPLSYNLNRQPTQGGERGGQTFGQLEIYSLLGHNARHNLREMATYKSDMQDEVFWSRVQQGFEPSAPQIPFSYKKFEALLRGAGIDVKKEGTDLKLAPLTDKEVLRLAGDGKNEITKGNLILKAKDLKEEKGGLYDPLATGGSKGDKWAYIRLAEPMPSPIFVRSGNRPGPVPVLLNLRLDEIEHIMEGKKELNGKVGGAAIKEALSKINVDKEIQTLKAKLPTLKKDALDKANKKLKYLLALKDAKLTPENAYMMHYLPVIPPVFRPIIQNDRGGLNIPSVTQIYKGFSTLNQSMKDFSHTGMEEEFKNPLRARTWDALKQLQSVGNYTPLYDDSGGKRKLKGILDIVAGGEGDQPKDAFFQASLIRRRQNMSIRSTIIPEPNLHIDQVGLPKNAAMELYKPFVVAQLGKWNLNPLAAREEIKAGTDFAYKALAEVVKDRPILLKRDPALHKFSVMAFQPKLIEGKAIQIHPLVTGGFNADFDGDTMAGTVPMSREAVDEAKKMFPSKNLFSPTSGNIMYTPSQESMLGLHLMSKWGKKTNKSFTNGADVDKAADRGEIGHNDVILLNGKETTLGRMRMAAWLPKGLPIRSELLHNPEFEIKKGTLNSLATAMAKAHPKEFPDAINALKDLGNMHSYKSAFSIGIKDLKPLKERDTILEAAHKEAERVKKSIKDKAERDEKLIQIYSKATDQIDAAAKKALSGGSNRLATMVYSGARGKPEQLRQMVAAPMLMQDATNRTIPTPVTRSYSEGLDVGDYWLAQHGARKGTLQRVKGTQEPGAMSKEILNTTMGYLVTSTDCGSNNGILLDVNHEDVYDRYLAKPYTLKDGKTVPAGTLITPEVWGRLKDAKHDKVVVRSPLKCHKGDGICAKCYGLNEAGNLHDHGTNVGVLAGQSMGEPAVQMAMDAFHSGGVAGGTRGAMSVSRFEKLENLLNVPKILKNESTLAKASGKVTDIKKDAAGGYDVFINGIRHYVPHKLGLNVSVGSEVKKGESISGGHVNPRKLLELTDIHNVQNHMTNELYHGLYKKEGVRRRNIETVVRALTNLTKVTDPGSSDWFHGDVVPLSKVEERNRSLPKGGKPVVHAPVLQAINMLPLSGTNWMARLNFERLKGTLQTGVSQGWKSDIHGSHPIPGIAVGTEFGKPPPTKPPYKY